MTTITTLTVVTSGQATDDNDTTYTWRLQTDPSSGHRSLHVQRHGGATLRWSEHLPLPDGPAETKLVALQIGQAIGFGVDRRGRRFVTVATNDLTSGSRRFDVVDTASERPSLARVCSASEEWAAVVAGALERVDPEPSDVPF